MTQKLIPIYDRKRALTRAELSEVINELSKKTEVKSISTDTQENNGRKQHFHVITIKEFREYPLVIGFVHEKYGRGIDLSTYFPKQDSQNCIDIYIRGYAKELNK